MIIKSNFSFIIWTFLIIQCNALKLSFVLPCIECTGCVGHRGYPEKNPENTILSLQQALLLGVDGLESDVRLTKDGEVIMMHDLDLDRTTNGTGLVEERNWKGYIEYLKCKIDNNDNYSDDLSSENVPKFQQVLDLLKREENKNIYLILDIKDDNNILILDAIFEIIKSNEPYDFSSQLHFGVWNSEFLIRTQELFSIFHNNKIPISHIGDNVTLARTEFFDNVESYNLDYIVILKDITGFAKQIKIRGRKLFVWTVDEEKDIEISMLFGVDAILSNDPLKCINVRRRLSRNARNRVSLKVQY
ncbi:hypothetical protein Glove_212g107 [Diversispora epigaea]|uniref:GP-PDE domain-containing protein n=1 Tax=Diversispora epigaea TaxID=1348612 RepID=A0A397IL51_9GLOM|nr:hypothetical protein Glove_212g107 [Diversispora epigaea]